MAHGAQVSTYIGRGSMVPERGRERGGGAECVCERESARTRKRERVRVRVRAHVMGGVEGEKEGEREREDAALTKSVSFSVESAVLSIVSLNLSNRFISCCMNATRLFRSK